MHTPHLTFRMDRERTKSLQEVARIYGSPSTSAFLREMVGAIVSSDMKEVSAFMQRLMNKMGEQLTLDLTAKAQEQSRKMVQAARSGAKRGRRPPKR